jgi:uncharacterized sulfatase
MARDQSKYPYHRIAATAEMAAGLKEDLAVALVGALEDRDSAVRYWAALGLLMRGEIGAQAGHGSLVSSMADPSPFVRIACAETLARFGEPADRPLALKVLADHADPGRNDVFVAMSALNAIDQIGPEGEKINALLRKTPASKPPHARYDSYVPRLLEPQE